MNSDNYRDSRWSGLQLYGFILGRVALPLSPLVVKIVKFSLRTFILIYDIQTINFIDIS